FGFQRGLGPGPAPAQEGARSPGHPGADRRLLRRRQRLLSPGCARFLGAPPRARKRRSDLVLLRGRRPRVLRVSWLPRARRGDAPAAAKDRDGGPSDRPDRVFDPPVRTSSRRGTLKLSVVIPAYNEARTIKEIVRRVREVPIEKEILIIDDCSTDGTRD